VPHRHAEPQHSAAQRALPVRLLQHTRTMWPAGHSGPPTEAVPAPVKRRAIVRRSLDLRGTGALKLLPWRARGPAAVHRRRSRLRVTLKTRPTAVEARVQPQAAGRAVRATAPPVSGTGAGPLGAAAAAALEVAAAAMAAGTALGVMAAATVVDTAATVAAVAPAATVVDTAATVAAVMEADTATAARRAEAGRADDRAAQAGFGLAGHDPPDHPGAPWACRTGRRPDGNRHPVVDRVARMARSLDRRRALRLVEPAAERSHHAGRHR